MLDTLAIEIESHPDHRVDRDRHHYDRRLRHMALFIYRLVSGFDREAVQKLRSSLGRAILLGLEFLSLPTSSTRSP